MIEAVIDASLAMAWCFDDEPSDYADSIARRLGDLELVVPAHWSLEVTNAFLTGERRGRCGPENVRAWLEFLRGLPIRRDDSTPSRAWHETLALARETGLTSYDAAYLELAVRLRAPLGSLDKHLRRAAKERGLPEL